MLGYLLYEKTAAEYNRSYIEEYIEEGKLLGMKIRLLLVESLLIGIEKNEFVQYYEGKRIATPDFIINRTRDSLLSKQYSLQGVRVYNSEAVTTICNNKAMTYQVINALAIPTIDSVFVKNNKIQEIVLTCEKDCIIKTYNGHGGSQVYLWKSECSKEQKKKQITELLYLMQGEDVVIQEHILGVPKDLRVYVIGKEIIACVLRTAKEGYRANYSLGGNVHLYELSSNERKTVEKIIHYFDFGFVGIDFIYSEDGRFLFNEIEDVVGSRMLYQCSDYNVVKKYLEHIYNDLVNVCSISDQ